MRLRAAVLLLAAGAAAAPAADVRRLRRQGRAGLGAILALTESADPDLRLRARRAAKEIALEVLRARAPAGMRLVPGRWVLTPREVRCEGGVYLGIREVTVKEFRSYLAATSRRTNRLPPDGRLPVTSVSHTEASSYARWEGARLPTFAELGHACSAAGRRRFPWGRAPDARRANTPRAGAGRVEPVGSRPLGRSPDGIEDLVGNVAEWTSTSRGRAPGLRYLVAGGSWKTAYSGPDRFTYVLRPEARAEDVGFRLARSVRPVRPAGAAPPAARGGQSGGGRVGESGEARPDRR